MRATRRLVLTMVTVLLITQPAIAWAGLATIAKKSAVTATVGKWSAYMTQPDLGGSVGNPQTIQWNGAITLPTPIGQVDNWDTVDLLSNATVDVIREEFVFTLTGTDNKSRSWSVSVCSGATWTISGKNGTCSSGLIDGETFSISGNGAHYVWVTLGSPNLWRVSPNNRLHLILTVGKGEGKPPGTTTVGVNIISPTSVDTTLRNE